MASFLPYYVKPTKTIWLLLHIGKRCWNNLHSCCSSKIPVKHEHNLNASTFNEVNGDTVIVFKLVHYYYWISLIEFPEEYSLFKYQTINYTTHWAHYLLKRLKKRWNAASMTKQYVWGCCQKQEVVL